MIFLVIVSYIVLGILLLLFVHLLLNLLSFRRLRTSTKGTTLSDSFVSLLVPARNEEAHIEMCVRSLVGQHYEQLEVLVLDDHSSDATAPIVQTLIDELPPTQKGRLQLLHGVTLPPGWVGKNFACHQLSRHAQGEYLFFTDADTVHTAGTVKAVIDCMQGLDVDLLTAQSEYELKGIAERLVMPLLCFRVFTLLPLTLVSWRPEPILAAGNGPLLCFHRSAYEAAGGHQAIKGCILEDVSLARAVKVAGYRMAFVDATEMISCHMYTSFANTWVGFSKTFFAFYNYSLIAALVIIMLDLLLFVVPPLLPLVALFVPLPFPAILLALANYSIGVLMRLLLALRFTRSQKLLTLLLCFLHPVAILLGCLILLNSMRWHYRKRGTEWKGRYYPS
ncbi:MAG TPA: glycosyltransferase [Ktedonobacteraceae bacterium]|nr:glycosyltransferase [Ktedonobacteraceae bacterium]